MGSRSPEFEDKRMNRLQRDQPLFTSRRHTPLHQPPEFFTESLNASYVPGTSPTKEGVHPETQVRSRRTLGTPRGLAASFKATSESDDVNRPPSSTSSSDHTHGTQSISKSRATRNSAHVSTPGQGKQISIVSPSSSASSPPGGLADTYQRINDEENLAQEDSVEDDTGMYDYDYTDTGVPEKIDESDLQRLQDMTYPNPLKASQKLSSHAQMQSLSQATGQGREKVYPRPREESDGESAVSDLDDLTDHSSTQASSQFAKDLQRVNDAANSDLQAFKKARLGVGVGLTVENLRRRDAGGQILRSTFRRGSVGSRGSDPSVNVPKEWGRRAKPGLDWLSRINNRSGRLTGDVPKKRNIEKQVTDESDTAEPLEEWVKTTVDAPIPSIEDGNPLPTASSQDSTQTIPKENTSPERGTEWDLNDDDFTARSLQISDSPPLRVRNNKVDPMLEREIDSLAKRAVTTNRLDQLREKTSTENLRQKLNSRSAEDLTQRPSDKSREMPRPRHSSLKFPLKPTVGDNSQLKSQFSISKAIPQDGRNPVTDSPVNVYRSTSDVSSIENGVDGGVRDDNGRSTGRPYYDRQDSRDLLRKLARATSESPTSAKDEQHRRTSWDTATKPTLQSDKKLPEVVEQALKPHEPGLEEKQKAREPLLPDLLHTDDLVQQTPQSSRSLSDLKTPLVTGAWIDTPLPSSGRGPPMPTPSGVEEDEDFVIDLGDETRKVATTDLIRKLNPKIFPDRSKAQRREPLHSTGPLVPKSALESIISAAKSRSSLSKHDTTSQSPKTLSDSEDDPTLLLGESTIQSLEEIMETEADTTRTTATEPPPTSDVQSEGESYVPETITPTTTTHLSDIQSYISRLGSVGPSIRDAKKRLATLERAISKPSNAAKSRIAEDSSQCEEAGEIHDFIWPCERCGCPARRDLGYGQDHLATISISIPKLWKWQKDDWRPRLTWLGFILVVWWGWWIADWIAW